MPYEVKKEGPHKFETVTEGTGKVHGTFPSREKALAQLRALYVHAPPEGEAHGGSVEGPKLSGGDGAPASPAVCPCSMCRGGEAGYAMGGEIPPMYEEPGDVSPTGWKGEEEDFDEDEEDEEEEDSFAKALRSRYRR